MRIIKTLGLALAGWLLPQAGAAAAPLIGPWPVRDPTQVLVLGTPHLSGIDRLRPEWLEPLLVRLQAWKPDVITIEALSGPECDLLRRYARSWPDAADQYCARTEKLAALGGKATGLDRPQAEAAADEALGKLGANPAPDDRRRLAALFAAAGDIGSAAVQWLRLAPAERRPGGPVDATLTSALDELVVRRNENYLIAAALAARLGLERVYPTDDHLSDRVSASGPPGLEQVLQKLWSGERPPLARKAQQMEAGLNGGDAVLAYYRFMNRADVGEQFVRADMGRAFAEPSAEKHGRRYVAWWETRNLRMVANIRAAIASRPGGRALVIVGAMHKPYFDAYLQMLHEVRLTPPAQVLGK